MVTGFPKYAKAVMGYIEPFSFHSTCQHSVTEMKPSLWTGVLVSNLSTYIVLISARGLLGAGIVYFIYSFVEVLQVMKSS